MRYLLILSQLWLGICLGQTSTTQRSSSPSSTTSSPANTWTVSVGKGDNSFRPDSLQANVGDTVLFQFYPANHSVVRAEYNYPCVPYDLINIKKPGFASGFKPVDQVLDDPPSFSVRINDTLPVFYYCSAPGFCIDNQMVGVINPNASVSLAVQKDAAKNSKYMLQPGDSFPAEGSSSSSTSSSSSGSSTSTTMPTVAASTNNQIQQKASLPSGAIAGIVLGALGVLGLAAALFFFMGRTKTLQENVHRQSMSAVTPPLPAHSSEPIYATGEPIYANGIMYFPVKPGDINRISLPAYGGVSPRDMTQSPMTYNQTSPGRPYVNMNLYDPQVLQQMQQQQRRNTAHQVNVVPGEMFAAAPKTD
ncbi:hypothetical protein BT63DRAFT_476508 [Microthyrium microscopicum]|uniref:Cupredoxin n=1 Tax=Microthyrium microscopicum TaxID=703497 RepID=A0A6A6UH71_9PEZI|nr:hypothetical protein BT63DRAFT_476508 [Microthyrium microscopicum]